MHRRDVLALLAAGGATASAGCSTPGRGTGAGDSSGAALALDADATAWRLHVDADGRRYLRTETAVHSVAADDTGEWTYENHADVAQVLPGPDLVYAATDVVEGIAGGPTAVVALDPDHGSVMWTTEIEHSPMALLGAAEGLVVGGSYDDLIGATGEHWFALGADDGWEEWVVPAGDASSGVIDGDTIFSSSGTGVAAYDLADGSRRWQIEEAPGRFAVRGDRLLFGRDRLRGYTDGGEPVWTFPGSAATDDPGTSGSPGGSPESGPPGPTADLQATPSHWAVGPGGRTVYVGDVAGQLTELTVADGSRQWTHGVTPGTALDRVLPAEEVVYCVADDAVVALGTDDRTERWRVSFADRSATSPQRLRRAGGTLFVLSENVEQYRRYLTAVDLSDGEVLWSRLAAIADTATAPDRSSLSVALRDGRLYTVTADRPLSDDDGVTTGTTGG